MVKSNTPRKYRLASSHTDDSLRSDGGNPSHLPRHECQMSQLFNRPLRDCRHRFFVDALANKRRNQLHHVFGRRGLRSQPQLNYPGGNGQCEWIGGWVGAVAWGGGLYSNVSCGKLFLCLGRANSREWDSNRVKLPPEIPQSTVAIKKKKGLRPV